MWGLSDTDCDVARFSRLSGAVPVLPIATDVGRSGETFLPSSRAVPEPASRSHRQRRARAPSATSKPEN